MSLTSYVSLVKSSGFSQFVCLFVAKFICLFVCSLVWFVSCLHVCRSNCLFAWLSYWFLPWFQVRSPYFSHDTPTATLLPRHKRSSIKQPRPDPVPPPHALYTQNPCKPRMDWGRGWSWYIGIETIRIDSWQRSSLIQNHITMILQPQTTRRWAEKKTFFSVFFTCQAASTVVRQLTNPV